jgi:hypothetical protein
VTIRGKQPPHRKVAVHAIHPIWQGFVDSHIDAGVTYCGLNWWGTSWPQQLFNLPQTVTRPAGKKMNGCLVSDDTAEVTCKKCRKLLEEK